MIFIHIVIFSSEGKFRRRATMYDNGVNVVEYSSNDPESESPLKDMCRYATEKGYALSGHRSHDFGTEEITEIEIFIYTKQA